jgi:hypothetical protein
MSRMPYDEHRLDGHTRPADELAGDLLPFREQNITKPGLNLSTSDHIKSPLSAIAVAAGDASRFGSPRT